MLFKLREITFFHQKLLWGTPNVSQPTMPINVIAKTPFWNLSGII